jgi:hypothetical protein
MISSMNAISLLLLLASTVLAADSPLVGTWLKDGAPFAEFRADGTGRVDHDAVRWKADGKTLTLDYGDGEVERLAYSLKGDALKTVMDGEPATFTRAGKPAGKAAAKAVAKDAPAPAKAGGDSLSKLLLSSPWCWFYYNQHAGTTRTERVVFRADGTWSSGASSELYSSGAAGTGVVGSNRGGGGRWKAAGGRLLMAEGGAPLEDAGLSVTRNSNGYPILKSDGKEYSQCD